jgi:tetratricopeptide (TPR) repeat protein
MESRVSGEQQADREWLPLPTAVATAAGLLIYGGVGLLTALPRELPLLQAGRPGNPAERVQLVRSCVEQRPYFIEARYQLALELLQAGHFDDATREYQAAQAANPSLAAGRYGLSIRDAMIDFYISQAVDHERHGRFELAFSCFQRALQLNPEPKKAAMYRNACAWYLADHLNRDLDTAEQYVLRALEYDPDEWAYLDTLAWVYYKQNRTDKALTTQLQAVQAAEERPRLLGDVEGLAEVYYHLGAIQEKLGHAAEARSAYAKALSKQPKYPEAQAGLDRLSSPSEEPEPRRPNPTGGTMI